MKDDPPNEASEKPVDTSSPPSSQAEYIEWAKATLGVDFSSEKASIKYKQTLAYAQNTAQLHPFFAGLDRFIKDTGVLYQQKTHSPLLMTESATTIHQKPYGSAVNKSFRQNVVWNEGFPEPPRGGWLEPSNWLARFNDLLRTTIVCKYIDGPKLLAEALRDYAKKHKLESRAYSQEKDDGYYAYHFYVYLPLDVLSESGDPQKVKIQVELQLTTQLQEILREMTHRFYEHSRVLKRERDTSKWKWEYRSNRFRTGYLSHTLHLLEAIIVELRDSQAQDESTVKEEERK